MTKYQREIKDKAIELLEHTLQSDCTNEEADNLTRAALTLLQAI